MLPPAIGISLGEWGDPANVIAIAGAAITLTTAVIAALASRRTRVRLQADQVACWIDRSSDGRLMAVVRNSSHQQIHDVLINVTRPAGSPGTDMPRAISERSAGDVGVQVIPVQTLAPQRTVTFPVRVSTLGRDVIPALVMHFRDTSGRGWLRDDHGRLHRHRSKLRAGLFGPGIATGTAIVQDDSANESGQTVQASSISGAAYSTAVMSAAAGNQLTVLLVPNRVQVEVEATGTISLGNEMKATIAYGEDERLLSITFHNLKPRHNRGLAESFRILNLDAFDTLVLMFHPGEMDACFDQAKSMIPIGHPSGGHIGEVLYDEEGDPVLVRVLDAERHMHPEFWRAA